MVINYKLSGYDAKRYMASKDWDNFNFVLFGIWKKLTFFLFLFTIVFPTEYGTNDLIVQFHVLENIISESVFMKYLSYQSLAKRYSLSKLICLHMATDLADRLSLIIKPFSILKWKLQAL
jgi:hypothetical protein